jgi:oligoendopeptidase F
MDRLSVYANMVSDLDVRRPGPQGRRQALRQLDSEVSAMTSWIDPELLGLPEGIIQDYLRREPGLAPYQRYFERLDKQRPHTLDQEAEEILSLAGMIQGDGGTIGSILRNAEMSWRSVRLSDGSDLKVDVIGYTRGRAKTNREDRVKTYNAFYAALSQYQQSLATTLANTAKPRSAATRTLWRLLSPETKWTPPSTACWLAK